MSTVKRPSDPHYKATLSMALHGARLDFHVAQDLFSSAGLDPGSAAILRTLAVPEYASTSRILDLGCGYGPLGLFLKAWDPTRTVHLVDRDALAVQYAAANAELNALEGVETYGSLGYDDVRAGDFDLIVSNIPAKAGPAAIESLLLDGAHFLSADGTMAIIVISRLASEVRAVLGRAGVEIVFERENRGYLCLHYRYTSAPAAPYANGFDRGIYDRRQLRYAGAEIMTVHGLPDFDTVGWATQLAIKVLPSLKGARHVVVLNPGQGLVPAVASRSLSISVSDRDRLAVRNAARHAELTGEGPPDAVVALVRQGEPVAVTMADVARHRPRRVLVAGSSTQVTRLTEAWAGDVLTRKRNHGFSAALIDLSH
jgi:SAM-dependent methyltransferase